MTSSSALTLNGPGVHLVAGIALGALAVWMLSDLGIGLPSLVVPVVAVAAVVGLVAGLVEYVPYLGRVFANHQSLILLPIGFLGTYVLLFHATEVGVLSSAIGFSGGAIASGLIGFLVD